jgi:hypothetical protein
MVEDLPNRDRKRKKFSFTDGAASAPPGRRGFVDKKEVAG